MSTTTTLYAKEPLRWDDAGRVSRARAGDAVWEVWIGSFTDWVADCREVMRMGVPTCMGEHPTREAAKAACEADWQSRDVPGMRAVAGEAFAIAPPAWAHSERPRYHGRIREEIWAIQTPFGQIGCARVWSRGRGWNAWHWFGGGKEADCETPDDPEEGKRLAWAAHCERLRAALVSVGGEAATCDDDSPATVADNTKGE